MEVEYFIVYIWFYYWLVKMSVILDNRFIQLEGKSGIHNSSTEAEFPSIYDCSKAMQIFTEEFLDNFFHFAISIVSNFVF